ncbi:transposase [Tenericutes bacterium MO-XQ]|nr:transposase [Tenericutes bacterium MO-XQ]
MNRSSYYKWLKRKDIVNETDKIIEEQILSLHELFNHILGYRRMTLFINIIYKTTYNIKRIRRHMRLLGISSAIRRKKTNYLRYKPEQVGKNILNRDFTASKPNEKWLTDVTEFKIIGSTIKLYLSAIIDLYDHSIVTYRLGTSNNNDLVFKTFEQAINKYPNIENILFHSDRGFQYTNRVFKKKLDDKKFIQSMSRVGKCIDNGPMEAFWGTLKCEMYNLNKFYSIDQLKMAIEEYIIFYNNQRYQPVLKGLTPIQYRNQVSI